MWQPPGLGCLWVARSFAGYSGFCDSGFSWFPCCAGKRVAMRFSSASPFHPCWLGALAKSFGVHRDPPVVDRHVPGGAGGREVHSDGGVSGLEGGALNAGSAHLGAASLRAVDPQGDAVH